MTHKGFYIKHGSNWAGPFSDIEQAGETAELSGWKIAEIIWMEDDDERLPEIKMATAWRERAAVDIAEEKEKK